MKKREQFESWNLLVTIQIQISLFIAQFYLRICQQELFYIHLNLIHSIYVKMLVSVRF
jgi:hypothetical protein